ncbi:MAG: 50S ribosomal protein L7ae-like protein [Bacillaceae bacterium]|nr:50S ribosomal protein L7ae-like protein [Bacillaceae bacterium]
MSYEKVEQATNLIVGTKQTIKAVEQGRVREVFVARDADQRVTSRVIDLCKKKHVPVTYVDSKRRLGKACGIDVSAAVSAIRNDG